jgi:hypothetical protein
MGGRLQRSSLELAKLLIPAPQQVQQHLRDERTIVVISRETLWHSQGSAKANYKADSISGPQ